ncbi:alpha/beta fold hydrolase [Anaeromyxobacter paludicola]|uniref:Homoserine O-acetyltransferase n=1 Tax=Anaeromyxobacter paludicola TaxID=2918171 RepID=A0ABN6N4T5_9BACT|nr:alpha/beta fold hydrolase [Anaeromyxobacter paludicola]BDG08171.1 homoserine O-acetyltransferase [Anaeromyxobacter paludicola]
MGERRRAIGALAALSLWVAAGPAEAEGTAPSYPGQKEGDWEARDFRFQGGETLATVRLHYVTLGTPRRDAAGRVTNAVLLLHGTSGTSRSLLVPTIAGELFGPGQPLDASRWYVILPDGLGRGGSTKPSDGLRARFPRYGYGDVVALQYLLVTQGLGVDRLRLVAGTSMGGMQTWMWAERYPDRVDAAMPIACQPIAISGRNLLFRHILTQAIRADPEWRGGDYSSQPKGWLATAPLWPMMLDSPARLQSRGPTRKAALALYDELRAGMERHDTNDFLYWVESSWDYDPEPGLTAIRARVLALNFADDAINPAEIPVEPLVKRVPRGRFVLVPASERTRGHNTLALAAVWKPYLLELLRELDGR